MYSQIHPQNGNKYFLEPLFQCLQGVGQETRVAEPQVRLAVRNRILLALN